MFNKKDGMAIKPYYENSIIFKEGQFGNVGYLIKTGEVIIYKIIKGKKITLNKLGPGDIFGEMGVITNATRTAYAEASRYCELVIINQDTLFKLLKQTPTVIQAIVKEFINRVTWLTRKIAIEEENITSTKFASICLIMDLLIKRELAKGKANDAGIKYSELIDSTKLINIRQVDLDNILKKISEFNLIRISKDKESTIKDSFIKLINPDTFVESALVNFKQLPKKKLKPEKKEYINISQLAKIMKCTSDDVLKKIEKKNIPEKFILFNVEKITNWIEESLLSFQ